jgi:hypothetical protein
MVMSTISKLDGDGGDGDCNGDDGVVVMVTVTTS